MKKNKNNLSKILNINDEINIKKENVKEINWLWSETIEESLNQAINNRLDLKIKEKIYL